MMISNAAWLAGVLQEAVPAFYIAGAIYLAALGGGHAKPQHLIAFSITGFGGYMLLNEPAWWFLPGWLTSAHWWIVALVGVLLLGIWLFADAIESSPGLKWPWERARDLWQWIRWRASWLGRALRSDEDDSR